ncbi:MAG: hypothetical protein ACRDRN_06780 [Sciscionella sp.]
MAKHRLKDRDAKEPGSAPGLLGRRKRQDDLFERSFRMCLRCGEEVYVLASSCRNCDRQRAFAPA